MTISDTFAKDENPNARQVRNGLDYIRVVLVETSHPGNIGSAARAMKTMGLSDLCLVSPKVFPHQQALALAANADDLLQQASVVGSLEEAIADCHWVVGTSARHLRSLSWEGVDSRECGKLAWNKSKQGRVALIFGRERNGLTNAELSRCHKLVHIPGNPDYLSLNLASAVQILAYECHYASLSSMQQTSESSPADRETLNPADRPVTGDDMQGYFEALETLMVESHFLDPESPGQLMPRLRRLYGKSQLTRSELNILHGMLRAFKRHFRQ